MALISKHKTLAAARKEFNRLKNKNPNRFYVIGGGRAVGYKLYSYPRQ